MTFTILMESTSEERFSYLLSFYSAKIQLIFGTTKLI